MYVHHKLYKIVNDSRENLVKMCVLKAIAADVKKKKHKKTLVSIKIFTRNQF